LGVSAVTGQGLDQLLWTIARKLDERNAERGTQRVPGKAEEVA